MLLQNARPDTEGADDGYLLLTVLVMVFLILLALSVAAPKVAKEIQRDKEQEAMQRGQQYRRAIQLYYKKFGAYPSDIKQLEKTNEIRFLRRRYTDPITGKDDWRLIHMGEAKVPPLGFFGQPLQVGLSSTSTGPGLGTGSIYAPSNSDSAGGTNGSSSTGSSTGLSNGSNGSAPGSSGFGFSNAPSNGSGSGFGSSGSGFGSSGSGLGSNTGGFGSPSTGGVGVTPTGTNGPGASASSSSTFGSAAPIVGVGIPLKKDSMLEYHKQKKYSDWEFVYDPQTDQILAGGVTNGGNANGSGTNNNPAGTNTLSSGTNNSGSSGSGTGSGFGNSGSGFGSAPSGNPTPTMPTSPQQQ